MVDIALDVQQLGTGKSVPEDLAEQKRIAVARHRRA